MSGFISEIDYDGGAASNFVEIVVPASIDASGYVLVIYNSNGSIVESFALGSPVSTAAGKNVYLIDSNDANWPDLKNSDGLALMDSSGSVLQFIAFKDPVTAVEGPATGQSAVQVGEHSGSSASLESTDGGASYTPATTSSRGTIPCYAQGTLIDTPTGLQLVETLRPGTLVKTLDGPPATILWTSSHDVALEDRSADRAPVLVPAGALGLNRPLRDLVVSPQHRILVGGAGAALPGFDTESLVPAKALTGIAGIRRIDDRKSIIWHHFACARHHVVSAEGCWSESLLLGPMVLAGLAALDLARLTMIFKDAAPQGALNGPPARPCPNAGKAARIIHAHLPEGMPLG